MIGGAKRNAAQAGLDAGGASGGIRSLVHVAPLEGKSVVEAIVEVLHQFHELGEDLVVGSRISKALLTEPSVAELANQVKAELGGKGWMRKLLTDSPDVEYIDVPDKEPHFRLTSLGDGQPFDVASLKTEEAEFCLPAEVQEQAEQMISRVVEVLHEASGQGEGFLSGSVIRTRLGEEFRDTAKAISDALGKQKGWLKKLLLTEPSIEQVTDAGKGEPCFRLVGVEPSPRTKKARLDTPKGKAAGKGKIDFGKGKIDFGKGKMDLGKGKMEKGFGKVAMGKDWMAKGMMYDPYHDPYAWQKGEQDRLAIAYLKGKGYTVGMPQTWGEPSKGLKGSAGPTKGLKGSANNGKGVPSRGALQAYIKGKGKGAAKAGGKITALDDGEKKAREQVLELPEYLAAEGNVICDLVREALQTHQDENGGFMEGCKLSKIAIEYDAAATAKVKTAFHGKGWLKKLLAADPSVEQVTVEGKDEPCFRLVE